MVIEVSIPSSMAMLHSFPVETVVGSHLQAAVTMKASNGDAISLNHMNLPFVVAGSLSCGYPSSIALIADEPGTHYFLISKLHSVTIY